MIYEFYISSIIQVGVSHNIVSILQFMNVCCFSKPHWNLRCEKKILTSNLCNKMILEVCCFSRLGVSQYFANNQIRDF